MEYAMFIDRNPQYYKVVNSPGISLLLFSTTEKVTLEMQRI